MPVHEVPRDNNYGPYARRPSAPFLAHLIATAQDEPQTREHRRAAPETAARAYAAAVESNPRKN